MGLGVALLSMPSQIHILHCSDFRELAFSNAKRSASVVTTQTSYLRDHYVWRTWALVGKEVNGFTFNSVWLWERWAVAHMFMWEARVGANFPGGRLAIP